MTDLSPGTDGYLNRRTFYGFPSGVNTSDDPRTLHDGQAQVLTNLLFDRAGMLRYPGGTSSVLTGKNVCEFIRYHKEADSLPSPDTLAVDCMIFAEYNGLTSKLWKLDESTGTQTVLFTNYSLLFEHDSCMVQFDDAVFATQRDTSLLVSRGGGNFIVAGLPNPESTPVDTYIATVTSAGAGNLDSSTGIPYKYIAVFKNRYGDYSNPTNPTAPTGATNENLQLNFPSPAATYISSYDITEVSLFRQGGTSSKYTFVKSFVPQITGGHVYDAATGTYPVDNRANRDITAIFPVYTRTQPPLGLIKIIQHGRRLAGIGQSYDPDRATGLLSPAAVHLSRINEPVAFGTDDNGVDDDGGVIVIDGDDANWNMDLGSSGSILVVGRLKSIYALYGDSLNSIKPDKVSDVGVMSRRSMVRAGNLLYYFGADRRWYLLGNENGEVISRQVSSSFDGLTDVELSRSVCWHHDRKLFVSIPKGTTDCRCLYYDLEMKAWGDMSVTYMRCHQGKSLARPLNRSGVNPFNPNSPPELLLGGSYGIRNVMNSSSVSVDFSVETPTTPFGKFGISGRVMGLYVEGALVQGSTPIGVTVTVTGESAKGTYVKTYSTALQRNSGRLLRITRPPARLTGANFKVRIAGTLTSGYIGKIEVLFDELRDGR